MSYIPPHKRHSKGGGSGSTNPSPTPIPESLAPHFHRSLNFRSFLDKKKRERDKGGPKIIYADTAVSKWFPVGLAYNETDDDHTEFVHMTRLEPFSLESFQRKFGEKPLTLQLNHDRVNECSEGRRVFLENPWSFVAENVKQDLMSAFQSVKNEMEDAKLEIAKPNLVARVGTILFHRGPSPVGSIEKNSLPESTLRELKGPFYTNVSPSYLEYIINEGVHKMGLDFEEEKDVFHVKLADNMQDATISCKCTLLKSSKKLKLFKIELNQVRHLVADMSCLDRNLDLRLMLYTKRIVMVLSEDEIKCIDDLIGSAVLDPEVKGGLRWPLGNDSAGDRFTVVGVWHTTTKSFRNSPIRLKVRHADRFDFRSSYGEVAREVIVKMPGIVSQLQVLTTNDDLLCEMLKTNLKLIWDICLCSGSLS